MTKIHSIDELYSGLALETWKKILPKDLHYHFGEVNKGGVDIFRQAVRTLYDFIRPGSSVLDCGCGWGGPAGMLISENGCEVEGVTISKQQFDFISEFKTYYEDLHEFCPNRFYDVALFMESYTHLVDAPFVLKSLAPSVGSVLIKDFVSHKTFYNQDWQMTIRSRQRFINEIEGSNLFEIKEIREFSDDCMTSSYAYWFKNILLMLDEGERCAQASLLWDLCRRGLGASQRENKLGNSSVRSILIFAERLAST